ncbi:MAG TPA: (Fe-S)-binding protein [Polyangiaceae bacterium]|jgi:Fe-S oxidoreductase|nr:(Fe-S)-binding protein [Polyangiaceae bacterium]
MNPVAMAVIIVSLTAVFAVSAWRRFNLLKVGTATWESRLSEIPKRLGLVWTFAFFQKKMRYYYLAGVAHQLIFLGFLVLLLRTLVLWGRGFSPSFNLFVLGPEPVFGLPLGAIYGFLKDVFAILVLVGAAVFVYLRVIRPQKRMTLGVEGLVILGIISTMMIADLTYDGANSVLAHRFASECVSPSSVCSSMATIVAPLAKPEGPLAYSLAEPGASLLALAFAGLGSGILVVLAHAGFWTHTTLVLVFANILPYTKHFHIITAIPNVFLGDTTPRGRLRPLAPSTEALMAAVEKATEGEDLLRARIGYARIEHFTWKDVLDFYTCTECGRCSDNCPAFTTGKVLSPKQFTLDLRNHLYGRQEEFLEVGPSAVHHAITPAPSEPPRAPASDATESAPQTAAPGEPPKKEAEKPTYKPIDLVPNVIHEDVLWGCTTCRACEEQCPVNITYVDKIVQMRRSLVVIRGEFPSTLGKPFEGMEGNGNPWNLARVDRASWTEGLNVKTCAEKPDAEVLYWVGCAVSYDDRAKKIARATAQLLLAAGVDFAILAEEETCTGDPARRAGNEYLFSMLAETNAATLNGYKEKGGVKKIITTCPHCFNTLAKEYPDFGARFEVVHHTDFMMELLARRKITPKNPVRAKVVYHDSCYLGRYNDIYESPREILRGIPGVELVEVEGASKKQGLCCGAGGAQMWMEEQNNNRVNVKRTLQLLDTGAKTIASACPFCMTMISDGIKSQSKEDEVRNMDVVEMLAISCGVSGNPADTTTDSGSGGGGGTDKPTASAAE